MKRRDPKKKQKYNDFIRYSSLAFEMMTIMALGTFLGYKLDQWMENEFMGFTLGLLILSVVGSVVYAIRNLIKK